MSWEVAVPVWSQGRPHWIRFIVDAADEAGAVLKAYSHEELERPGYWLSRDKPIVRQLRVT